PQERLETRTSQGDATGGAATAPKAARTGRAAAGSVKSLLANESPANPNPRGRHLCGEPELAKHWRAALDPGRIRQPLTSRFEAFGPKETGAARSTVAWPRTRYLKMRSASSATSSSCSTPGGRSSKPASMVALTDWNATKAAASRFFRRIGACVAAR